MDIEQHLLDAAIRRQLDKIAHSTLLGLASPPSILLARELVRIAPKGLTRVFYSDDGSTAVEVALKMAIQYWQQRHPPQKKKKKFVRLDVAYHGDTMGSMSVGGISLFHERFRPLLFPAIPLEAPYCYRCPLHLRFRRVVRHASLPWKTFWPSTMSKSPESSSSPWCKPWQG